MFRTCRSTLHLACAEGNLKVVECLVMEGAHPNLKDRWGQTPLQARRPALRPPHARCVSARCPLSASLRPACTPPVALHLAPAAESSQGILRFLLFLRFLTYLRAPDIAACSCGS